VNRVRLQNRFTSSVLALCLIGLAPSCASAWGSKGHRIIAQLAWNYLSEPAREDIKRLLNGEDFVSASTWADEIKPRRAKERTWHFVSIPLGATFDDHRDCKDDDCLVEKIEDFKKDLASPNKSPRERLEALKYLIHLVGDIHQPLHCSDNNDQGGNTVRVTFFGDPTNLHKVWDIDMIEKTGLGEGRYVEVLSTRGYNIDYPTEIAQWATESNGVAQRYAYRFPNNSKSDSTALGLSYYQYCLPALDLQLARAGIRLRMLLEETLGAARSKSVRTKR
jgi:hypothetical protein